MTLGPADLAAGTLIHSLHQHSFIHQICMELLLLPSGVLGAGDMEGNKTVLSLQEVYFQVEEVQESKKVNHK